MVLLEMVKVADPIILTRDQLAAVGAKKQELEYLLQVCV